MAFDSETGKNVTNDYLKIHKKFDDAFDKIEKICPQFTRKMDPSKPHGDRPDTSVTQLLSEVGFTYSNSNLDKLHKAIEVDIMFSDYGETMSVVNNVVEEYSDQQFKGNLFVTDPRGYVCVLDPMIEFLRTSGKCEILLKQEVQKVDYGNGVVTTSSQ